MIELNVWVYKINIEEQHTQCNGKNKKRKL